MFSLATLRRGATDRYLLVCMVWALVASSGCGAQARSFWSVGAARPDVEDWVEVREDWLRVMTDGHGQTAARLSRRLIWFDSLLVGVTGYSRRPSHDFHVVMLRSRDAYRHFVPGKPTGGVHVDGEHGSLAIVDASRQTRSARILLFHEYVHGFFSGLDGPHVPHWYEEAMAEYMSWAVVDDERIVLGGPVETAVPALRAGAWMSLASLLTIDPSDRAYRDRSVDGDYHASAWALLHYLRLAMPGGRDVLEQYLELVGFGLPSVHAMEQASMMRLEDLERSVHAHIASGDLPAETLPAKAFRISRPRVTPRAMSAADVNDLFSSLETLRATWAEQEEQRDRDGAS